MERIQGSRGNSKAILKEWNGFRGVGEFDGGKALLAVVATWKGRFFVHVSRCEAMGAVRFRVSVSVSQGGPSEVQAKSGMQSTGLPRFTRPHVHRSDPGTVVVNVGEASRFLPVSKLNAVYEAAATHEAAFSCRSSRSSRSRSRS